MEVINERDLSWILNTSIEDAKYRIRSANLPTLREALQQEKKRTAPRVTLIKSLEAKIRAKERALEKIRT